jgi:hypothetical protein
MLLTLNYRPETAGRVKSGIKPKPICSFLRFLIYGLIQSYIHGK